MPYFLFPDLTRDAHFFSRFSPLNFIQAEQTSKQASKQAAVLLVIFLGFIFVLQSNLGFLWPPTIHIIDAYVVGNMCVIYLICR